MIHEVLEDLCWPEPDARFSGFQFSLSVNGEVTRSGFGGTTEAGAGADHITSETVFDLASVTKLFTASLAAVLHAEGEIDLDAPLSSWTSLTGSLGELSTRQLLTHTSGLPPWWEEQDSRAATIAVLKGLVPDQRQVGELVYSCTGYSLFAVCLEERFGVGFDALLRERLLAPIGLDGVVFNPDITSTSIAVAKETVEEIAPGLVHDPRARAMAGVSGNAGLFANARNTVKFFSEVINPESALFVAKAKHELFTPTEQGEWDQGIGFRHNDVGRLGAASHFFSHSGFTGTLALVEPESQVVGVLLTNRLQCNTTREEMAVVYQKFAEWVGGQVG